MSPASAQAVAGDLAQKPGLLGCTSETGTGGACTDGVGLAQVRAVTVSPDGKNAYAASRGSNALTIFDRNPATGALTQKPGTAGCVSEDGSAGACADGKALVGATSVALSTDNRSVYVAAGGAFSAGRSVAVFDRDPATGAVTQKAGTAGCVSEDGSAGACIDGKALDGAFSVAISPDDRSVYVASFNSSAVAIFDRDTATGALTQKAGTPGCVSESGSGGACVDGRALTAVLWVTVSPDGKSVYSHSIGDTGENGAVAVFDRDAATGALTQKAGAAGCASEDGSSDCTDGKALHTGTSVVVSPDNRSVYATSDDIVGAGGAPAGEVAIFDRDLTTGALTQKAGTAGCISDSGNGATCVNGAALNSASAAAASPDGQSVYVAAYGTDGGVAIFNRDPATGALTQKAGTAGCVSEAGNTGACTDGFGLTEPVGVTVSPDDKSVYVAAQTAGSVAVFDRDALPETTITSGVGQNEVTTVSAPTFGFSSNEAGSTFVCRIDGGAPLACASPFTTPSLAIGQHTFSVVATDATGNTDPTPATRTFTVASAPPGDGAPPGGGGGGSSVPPAVEPPAVTPPLTTLQDLLAPSVSGFGIANATFAVGPDRTPVSGSATQVRKGTTFRYTLSETASVRIVIAQRRSGRRRGGRCVAPSRRLRRARRCTRLTTRGALTRTSRAGANRVAFSGRVGSRALRPGRYQARLTATDTARNVSRPRTVFFRIVRR